MTRSEARELLAREFQRWAVPNEYARSMPIREREYETADRIVALILGDEAEVVAIAPTIGLAPIAPRWGLVGEFIPMTQEQVEDCVLPRSSSIEFETLPIPVGRQTAYELEEEDGA